MPDDGAQQLATEFRRAHEKLTRSGDATAALQQLVDLACTVIDGCDWAAITAWPAEQRPRTLVSTGPVSQTVDELQYDVHQGPCLTASQGNTPAWIPFLDNESRWPEFTRRTLAETPVRSSLSFHLTDPPRRSALNLYAATPGALDSDAVATGALFASHAAVLVAHADSAQESVDLHRALATSRQIGAAIGILMKTHNITEDTAFAMLRAVSNRLNRKLKDVADDVTDTGRLPSS